MHFMPRTGSRSTWNMGGQQLPIAPQLDQKEWDEAFDRIQTTFKEKTRLEDPERVDVFDNPLAEEMNRLAQEHDPQLDPDWQKRHES